MGTRVNPHMVLVLTVNASQVIFYIIPVSEIQGVPRNSYHVTQKFAHVDSPCSLHRTAEAMDHKLGCSLVYVHP